MHPLALGDNVKVRVLAAHPDAVMGELFHLGSLEGGGHFATPIGHFIAAPQPGHPEQRPHWRVEAYFMADAAVPVAARADYPGALPERLADQLIASRVCTAPLLLYAHVGRSTGQVQRGSLW